MGKLSPATAGPSNRDAMLRRRYAPVVNLLLRPVGLERLGAVDALVGVRAGVVVVLRRSDGGCPASASQQRSWTFRGCPTGAPQQPESRNGDIETIRVRMRQLP
jgi:hypothetical protein